MERNGLLERLAALKESVLLGVKELSVMLTRIPFSSKPTMFKDVYRLLGSFIKLVNLLDTLNDAFIEFSTEHALSELAPGGERITEEVVKTTQGSIEQVLTSGDALLGELSGLGVVVNRYLNDLGAL